MTLVLRPLGSGNHSPVIVVWSTRLRKEQPTPMEFKRGDRVPFNGRVYRVSEVRA